MTPASIRYKNPGAMWGNPIATKWGAKKAVKLNDGLGQNNEIAVFDSYVQGICAQLDLWRSSPKYRNKPFSEAIRVWSGGNSVEQYISFVLARVPITRDTIMNDALWKSPRGIMFLKAQAWHEAGRKYPAPDADWVEAQRRVFNGFVDKPPPDVEPVKPKKPKPMAQSKTLWASIVAALSSIGGFLTDWRTLALVVVLVALGAVVWFRAGKPDIRGWFR